MAMSSPFQPAGHGCCSNKASEDTGQTVDPVCGMPVDPATTAHRVAHDGQDHFFCSAGCRAKFVADPDRYLDGTRQLAPVVPGAIYTCPMHPEVRQEGPGSCPICGMALEPETVIAEAPVNHELIDFTRRLWIGAVLTLPVFALEMGGHLTCGSRGRPPTGFSSPLRRPWCCGPAGRFFSGAGLPSATAASTCSP